METALLPSLAAGESRGDVEGASGPAFCGVDDEEWGSEGDVVSVSAGGAVDGHLIVVVRESGVGDTLLETGVSVWGAGRVSGGGEDVGGSAGGVGYSGSLLRLPVRKVSVFGEMGAGAGGGESGEMQRDGESGDGDEDDYEREQMDDEGGGGEGCQVGFVACGSSHAVVLCRGKGASGECGVRRAAVGRGKGHGGEGGCGEEVAGNGGGAATWRMFVWGSLETGQLGLEIGFGAVQDLLQQRLVPATLGLVTHSGTACCLCRCDNIKGVRYLLVGAGEGGGGGREGGQVAGTLDLCSGCMSKHGAARGADFIGNRFISVVCPRKLPPGFRPRLADVDMKAVSALLEKSANTPDDEPAEEEAEGAGGGEMREGSEEAAAAESGVRCEGCGLAPIKGCCFLCANCPDGYCLCERCHADHRARHLSSHLFLRLPRHLPPLTPRERTLAAGAEGRGQAAARPLLPLLFPQLVMDVFVP